MGLWLRLWFYWLSGSENVLLAVMGSEIYRVLWFC
jgi:hypothetical protein